MHATLSTLLETWPLFADAKGDAIPSEFPDLLHPNMAGYVKWAAALRPIFATLGLIESEPYQFVPEPGFVSLFDGKDMTGWCFRPTSEGDKGYARKQQATNPNAPAWPIVTNLVGFENRTSSTDGRFVALNGRLVATTPPEGRRVTDAMVASSTTATRSACRRRPANTALGLWA